MSFQNNDCKTKQMKNLFATFLDLLEVRHTRSFSESYFKGHSFRLPHDKVRQTPFFLLLSNYSSFFFFYSVRTLTFVRLSYLNERGLSETAGLKPKDRPCSIRAVKQSHFERLP